MAKPVLQTHAEKATDLFEWFEDCTGVHDKRAIGSRVVVVAHESGYGMSWVAADLFARVHDAYDTDEFWNPTLDSSCRAQPSEADGPVPFVWLSGSARDATGLIRDLALQLEELQAQVGKRTFSMGRPHALIAGMLANVVGLSSFAAGPAVGIAAAVASNSLWAVDALRFARDEREGIAASLGLSTDLGSRMFRSIARMSSAVPTILFLRDGEVADPQLMWMLRAVLYPESRVLVVFSGERESGDVIRGEVGAGLGGLRPDRIVPQHLVASDPAPAVGRHDVVREMERLLPDFPIETVVRLSQEVGDLDQLATWATVSNGELAPEQLLGEIGGRYVDPRTLGAGGISLYRSCLTVGGLATIHLMKTWGKGVRLAEDMEADGLLVCVGPGVWNLASGISLAGVRQFTGDEAAKTWSGVVAALREVDPASWEARLLASAVSNGIVDGQVRRSNLVSEQVFAIAALAAECGATLEARRLGTMALQIRQGGSPSAAWLVLLAQWRAGSTDAAEDASSR